MKENDRPPAQVKDILDGLLSCLGIESKIKQMSVLKSWPDVVGKRISKHSCPVAIRKGNLFVNVDSSGWLAQLSHFKEKIILEFNQRQGEEIVKNIYFRIGKVPLLSPEDRKVKNRLSKIKLNKEDEQWIDKTVKRIKDRKLKRLLKRILSKYKRLNKIKREK